MCPLLFIWNVGRHKLGIDKITVFTDDMQVNIGGLGQAGFATNEYVLVVGVFFDDGTCQNCFDHMASFESLFQGMPYRMTLDEVMPLSHTFTNSFDIHSRYSDAFSLVLLRLTLRAHRELPRRIFSSLVKPRRGCDAVARWVSWQPISRVPLMV